MGLVQLPRAQALPLCCRTVPQATRAGERVDGQGAQCHHSFAVLDEVLLCSQALF